MPVLAVVTLLLVFVMLVSMLAMAPPELAKLAAISPSVSKVPGAELIKLLMAVLMAVSV